MTCVAPKDYKFHDAVTGKWVEVAQSPYLLRFTVGCRSYYFRADTGEFAVTATCMACEKDTGCEDRSGQIELAEERVHDRARS